MKIAFTTLGCPHWDLDTICRRGREYGFDGVDLRGYLDTLDVTLLPEFTTQAGPTRRRLADAGLEVSGVSTSIRVCDADALARNLDEARRTIETANGLGALNVRVFGGGDLSRYSRAELAETGRETLEQILALDGAGQLRWLFETHDLWISSADCRLLLDKISDPAFGVLWDMGHTPRMANETPVETYAQIGDRIAYTHIKDSIHDPGHPQAMEDGWRYVFPGQGQLPLEQSVRLLREKGYDGWLVFEHEKRWHPTLPEPEEAFAAYANWVRAII